MILLFNFPFHRWQSIQRSDTERVCVRANKSRLQSSWQVQGFPQDTVLLPAHSHTIYGSLPSRLWHFPLCRWLHFIHTKYIEYSPSLRTYHMPGTLHYLILQAWGRYYSHFTDEELEALRGLHHAQVHPGVEGGPTQHFLPQLTSSHASRLSTGVPWWGRRDPSSLATEHVQGNPGRAHRDISFLKFYSAKVGWVFFMSSRWS